MKYYTIDSLWKIRTTYLDLMPSIILLQYKPLWKVIKDHIFEKIMKVKPYIKYQIKCTAKTTFSIASLNAMYAMLYQTVGSHKPTTLVHNNNTVSVSAISSALSIYINYITSYKITQKLKQLLSPSSSHKKCLQ